jgi:hypothetical protein
MNYLQKLDYLKTALETNKKVSFKLINSNFAETNVNVIYINNDDVLNKDFKIKHKDFVYTYFIDNITIIEKLNN